MACPQILLLISLILMLLLPRCKLLGFRHTLTLTLSRCSFSCSVNLPIVIGAFDPDETWVLPLSASLQPSAPRFSPTAGCSLQTWTIIPILVITIQQVNSCTLACSSVLSSLICIIICIIQAADLSDAIPLQPRSMRLSSKSLILCITASDEGTAANAPPPNAPPADSGRAGN